jgi:hypothetical protein
MDTRGTALSQIRVVFCETRNTGAGAQRRAALRRASGVYGWPQLSGVAMSGESHAIQHSEQHGRNDESQV